MAAVMVHPDLPRQPIVVPDEAVPTHELSGWVELEQPTFTPDEPEVDQGVPADEDTESSDE